MTFSLKFQQEFSSQKSRYILTVFLVFLLSSSAWSATTDKDLTLDDGTADSPQVILRDQDDFTLTIQKNDAGEAVILNDEAAGVLNLIPSNDTDDYMSLSTAADLPGLFWQGVLAYTNAPSIRISATGELEYRDEDELTYTPFDTLATGSSAFDDLTDVTVAGAAQGDIVFFDGTEWVLLTAGTSGYFLMTQGAGADPVWADGASKWTRNGSILHPNTSATEEIAVGGTTEAGADIFLGADGDAVFNQQGNDADFRVEGDNNSNLLTVDASADAVGIGTNVPDTTLDIDGTLSATPSSTVNLGSGGQLTATKAIMRVQSTGGAVTLGTPAVTAGVDGQIVTIVGVSDLNTVQFTDDPALQLERHVSFTMGAGDVLMLVYDGLTASWVEMKRSNN